MDTPGGSIEGSRFNDTESQYGQVRIPKKFYFVLGGSVGVIVFIGILSIIPMLISPETEELNVTTTPNVEETTTQLYTKPTNPLSVQAKFALNELASNLNSSVDPCEDFYEFACGSFRQKYPLLKNKSEVNYFTLYKEQVYRTIVHRLEGKMFNSNETIAPLIYMRNIWNSCVEDSSKTSDKMNNVTEYFKQLDSLDSWKTKFTKLTKDGYNVLLTIEPSTRTRNKVEVSFDGPELEFEGANSTYDSSPLIEYYADLIKLYKPETEKSDRVKLAREIIDFEHWMSTNKSSSVERAKDPQFKVMRVKQLNQMTELDWNKTLGDIFGKNDTRITYNRAVILDVKYIENLKKLVESKDETFLGEYFKLLVLRESCFFLGQECRDLHFKMVSSIEKFNSKKEYEQKKCFNRLEKYLPELLFKVYDPHFSTFEKVPTKNFANLVLTKVDHFVGNITWMDTETKERVYDRIRNKLRIRVKSPAYLESKLTVEEKYSDVPFINSTEKIDIFNYLPSTIKFNKWRQNRVLKGRGLWPLSLFATHPVWAEGLDELFVPDFFVHGPFVANDLPPHIRFGFFGSLLAHEMTHQFDSVANNFSEIYKNKQFWSDWTREQFNSKMNCLIDAFDGQEVGSKKINGSSTLNENLADLIGLKVAYELFTNKSHTSQPNSTKFPEPLDEMADERLFYLSYANTHCSNEGQELPVELKLGLSSPRKFRVNLPLAHSKEFAQAFSCKAGTKMNPTKKCPIE